MSPASIGRESRELCCKLHEIGQRIYTLGMAYGTSGNISARLNMDHIVIKGTGSCMGYCNIDDYFPVRMDGKPVNEGKKPSKETDLHIGIYKVRPEAGAVFHVHTMFSTVLSLEGDEIPLLSLAGKTYLRRIPVLPEMKAGSAELAEAVKGAFESKDIMAILLRGHGIVVAGRDIEHAFNITTLVEDSAKISYYSMLLRSK